MKVAGQQIAQSDAPAFPRKAPFRHIVLHSDPNAARGSEGISLHVVDEELEMACIVTSLDILISFIAFSIDPLQFTLEIFECGHLECFGRTKEGYE